MEGPGMSLFQGAASIHINSSAQERLDEQEELEDQKRRNEELQHKLANAFDDFLDEDEASSVNSSGNFTLHTPHTNGGHQVTLANQEGRRQPPTYVESLTHLKEQQESPRQLMETPVSHHGPPVHSETPVTHHGPLVHCETPVTHHGPRCDDMKTYTPCAGGDAHNHYYQDYRGHMNGIDSYDARQDVMNSEQLKVMYEMRVKECQQLAAQVDTLEKEVTSLRGRMQAACSDRDKAELSLQEAHHLLASNKHKLMELEQRASSLSQQLRAGEEDRQRLTLELAAATGALQDAQRRLMTLQVAHSHDTDALFREQQDRHREEIDRLQNDLIRTKNRLDEKENEIKILDKRCLEKDREKEAMLIEQGSMVKRLVGELDAAQSTLLAADEKSKQEKAKLESALQELGGCRTQLAAALSELQQWRLALQQLAGVLPTPGEPPSPKVLLALKDMFLRQKQQVLKLTTLQEDITERDKALERYKKQETELRSQVEAYQSSESQLKDRIAALQSKVTLLGRDDEARELEQRNAALAADLADARQQLKALGLQYAELELECSKLRGRDVSAGAQDAGDVLRELERCNAQLRDALRDNGELKNLYLQACSARDAMSRELKEVQSSARKDKDNARLHEQTHVERLRKETERVQQLVAELTSAKQELETANQRVADMQRQFTDTQRQFTDRLDKYLEDEKSAMRNGMSSCAQCEKLLKQIPCLEDQITECTLKLAAAESNSQLISELKDKAEFFQRYITQRYQQLGDRRSVGTSTAPQEPQSSSEHTDHGSDAEDLAVKTTLMLKEKAIRDQIADKYTLEMKTMEMNCSRRVKEIEVQHYQTIMKLKELVESKAQQVDVLKNKLLSEQGIATQMLDAKEKEISELIKEHNELQQQCQQQREDLAKLTHKHEHRLKKMAAHEALLQQQSDEWKDKAKTAVLEHQTLKKKYSELKTIRREVEDKCLYLQNELQTVQEKYTNCKKTVLTYKDYINKKDEHIGSEMQRIQSEYRAMFARLQVQLERASQRLQPASAFCDYEERINQLGEEFARITQYRQPDSAP